MLLAKHKKEFNLPKEKLAFLKKYQIKANLIEVKFEDEDYEFKDGGSEIVGDKVMLPEIKMRDGKIQFEKVENGEVLYIENGIYGVLNPKTKRIHQVSLNQIKFENGGMLESKIDELYKKSKFINDDFNWKLKLLEMIQDNSIEAYNIWNKMSSKIEKGEYPTKIYISRRTHILNNTSNIGTNYTTRRRCINEDDVVSLMKSYGYVEVFCESMTMTEKITMFRKATHVAGFIGGGMSNLIFSPQTTNTICIITPYFLDINMRFKFSMYHTNIEYADATILAPYKGEYPLYIRVKINDINSPYYEKIGEIDSYIEDTKYNLILEYYPYKNLGEYMISDETFDWISVFSNLKGALECMSQYSRKVEDISKFSTSMYSPFASNSTYFHSILSEPSFLIISMAHESGWI
jgi:hypothetical protein